MNHHAVPYRMTSLYVIRQCWLATVSSTERKFLCVHFRPRKLLPTTGLGSISSWCSTRIQDITTRKTLVDNVWTSGLCSFICEENVVTVVSRFPHFVVHLEDVFLRSDAFLFCSLWTIKTRVEIPESLFGLRSSDWWNSERQGPSSAFCYFTIRTFTSFCIWLCGAFCNVYSKLWVQDVSSCVQSTLRPRTVPQCVPSTSQEPNSPSSHKIFQSFLGMLN